jgi:hypothetical protein
MSHQRFQQCLLLGRIQAVLEGLTHWFAFALQGCVGPLTPVHFSQSAEARWQNGVTASTAL